MGRLQRCCGGVILMISVNLVLSGVSEKRKRFSREARDQNKYVLDKGSDELKSIIIQGLNSAPVKLDIPDGSHPDSISIAVDSDGDLAKEHIKLLRDPTMGWKVEDHNLQAMVHHRVKNSWDITSFHTANQFSNKESKHKRSESTLSLTGTEPVKAVIDAKPAEDEPTSAKLIVNGKSYQVEETGRPQGFEADESKLNKKGCIGDCSQGPRLKSRRTSRHVVGNDYRTQEFNPYLEGWNVLPESYVSEHKRDLADGSYLWYSSSIFSSLGNSRTRRRSQTDKQKKKSQTKVTKNRKGEMAKPKTAKIKRKGMALGDTGKASVSNKKTVLQKKPITTMLKPSQKLVNKHDMMKAGFYVEKQDENHLLAQSTVDNLGIKVGRGRIVLSSSKMKDGLKLTRKNQRMKLEVDNVELKSDPNETQLDVKNSMGVNVKDDLVRIDNGIAHVNIKDRYKDGAVVKVNNGTAGVLTAGLSVGKQHGSLEVKDVKSGSKVNMLKTGDVDVSTHDQSSAVRIKGNILPDIDFEENHVAMGFKDADLQAKSRGEGIEIDPKETGIIDIDDGVMNIHVSNGKLYIRKKKGSTDVKVQVTDQTSSKTMNSDKQLKVEDVRRGSVQKKVRTKHQSKPDKKRIDSESKQTPKSATNKQTHQKLLKSKSSKRTQETVIKRATNTAVEGPWKKGNEITLKVPTKTMNDGKDTYDIWIREYPKSEEAKKAQMYFDAFSPDGVQDPSSPVHVVVPRGPWGPWSPCGASCGQGVQTRTRSCGGTMPCRGRDVLEKRLCHGPKACRGDDMWSSWSSWSHCSVSCMSEQGLKERTRTCQHLSSASKGPSCRGPDKQTVHCRGLGRCLQAWGAWSEWSACSVTCGLGSGEKWRKRNCKGRDCPHKMERQAKTCYSKYKCPVVWGPWSLWGACSSTCAGMSGVRIRTRDCHSSHAALCSRYSEQQEKCKGDSDCLFGIQWSAWSPWSRCSVTCGSKSGRKQRKRTCHRPSSASKPTCEGASTQTAYCTAQKTCPQGSPNHHHLPLHSYPPHPPPRPSQPPPPPLPTTTPPRHSIPPARYSGAHSHHGPVKLQPQNTPPPHPHPASVPEVNFPPSSGPVDSHSERFKVVHKEAVGLKPPSYNLKVQELSGPTVHHTVDSHLKRGKVTHTKAVYFHPPSYKVKVSPHSRSKQRHDDFPVWRPEVKTQPEAHDTPVIADSHAMYRTSTTTSLPPDESHAKYNSVHRHSNGASVPSVDNNLQSSLGHDSPDPSVHQNTHAANSQASFSHDTGTRDSSAAGDSSTGKNSEASSRSDRQQSVFPHVSRYQVTPPNLAPSSESSNLGADSLARPKVLRAGVKLCPCVSPSTPLPVLHSTTSHPNHIVHNYPVPHGDPKTTRKPPQNLCPCPVPLPPLVKLCKGKCRLKLKRGKVKPVLPVGPRKSLPYVHFFSHPSASLDHDSFPPSFPLPVLHSYTFKSKQKHKLKQRRKRPLLDLDSDVYPHPFSQPLHPPPPRPHHSLSHRRKSKQKRKQKKKLQQINRQNHRLKQKLKRKRKQTQKQKKKHRKVSVHLHLPPD